jgi:hypothetical protein
LLIPDVEAYCSKRLTEVSKPGDYLANLHPSGVAKAIREEISALFAVPIPDNWVKENNRFSIGNNGKSPAYHELPTSLGRTKGTRSFFGGVSVKVHQGRH